MRWIVCLILWLVWLTLAAIILSFAVCDRCCGAPSPFPVNRRGEFPRLDGAYLLSWGVTSPGYLLTAQADGTHHTVCVQLYEDGRVEVMEWSKPFSGGWRYDRSRNVFVIVESSDGGNTLGVYEVDAVTLKGTVISGLGKGLAVSMKRQ